MAFIPFTDGVHVTINATWDGQLAINDLFFLFEPGAPSLTDVTTIAEDIDAWWGAGFLPLVCDTYHYNFTRARGLTSISDFEAEISTSAGVGAVTSESVPNNVCPCVSFRTGVAGRSYRGRNYVAGTPNTKVVGNIIDNGFQADIVTLYDQILQGGSADPTPWQWVVASFVHLNAPRTAALATPIVEVLWTDNIVDSQRRRLPGRGR